ncbi:DeoR/GlpR family DNA-binding transcription regulator [Anaerostipes sp.]|uniref:DeoR/GlpR family DNA-binding transcription regulator n=1 Tax=Anaerostipes sp. TaxID=1872530 RepID=UPI00258D6791|nr:DeoR/GlpR family DNA-binding transcription regulator [Anaerostipes sp.]MCI5622766.1 DeoR/GlpR family DNA-binding transcription regulator [Anaerostipes sp.]
MFARERKESILIYMRQHKKASIKELIEEFHVTGATIRTDLRELESEGLLIRTHGGAILNQETVERENLLALRKEIYYDEKRRIARKAMDFVEEGDIILVDSGTTMVEFASGLTSFNNLKVVTNDLTIALGLQKTATLDVILIGGNVRNRFECTIGSFGIDFLKRIYVDKVFMSPNSLSISKGMTSPYEETAAMKRAMMQTSGKRYVLCDSSKIGKKNFCKFADLNEFTCLITDDGIRSKDAEAIKKQGLDIVIAEAG